MLRYHASLITITLLLAPLALGHAAGTVNGRGRFEKIKGRPSAGYQELYEWNGYLSAHGEAGPTQSYRLGAGTGGGYYSWTANAGDYNIYVSQPIFFARPKLVTGVHINDGQTITQNTELNLDYSCYFTDWWPDYQQTWYQTFVATGTSINRISFRLAGTNATSVTVSVRSDNGGSVVTWPAVGISKSVGVSGTGDTWVGFRSGQIPTVPGQRYAIRLYGQGGSDGKFAPFARQEDGAGYTNGQAYDTSGNARSIDLNICVFSDNDGTVIYYCGTGGAIEELSEWCGTCGQTFRASGSSLAACDLWFASTNWDIDARFTIRAGGPGGAQVGRTKIGHGAWSPGGTGMMGVSWAPGEVALTPGSTYYIEMSVIAGATGWTPLRFYKAEDAYAGGQAFISSNPQSYDLNMTIMEYASVAEPTATPPGFYKAGWNLTSVPVTPTDPAVSSVFADLIALGNSLSNNVYRYQAGVGYNVYPGSFTTIDRGRGYWLWLTTVSPTTVVTVVGETATGNVSLPLSAGWNLIGHPFPQAVSLANCQVTNGVSTVSFPVAVAAGWVGGTLYYWEPGSGYQVLSTAGYGDDTSLRPWRGYWVRAVGSGMQLIVPKPS